jgi:hypothetical protein
MGSPKSTAQLILNPRFFGAYIVNNQNDTARGMVKLPKSASKGDFSYTDIMWKVRFINQDGIEQKITPNEIRQFTFWLENKKEISFVSRPNQVKAFAGLMNDNEKMFLEVVQSGHIKLFKGYFYNNTANGIDVTTINYIQKGQGPIRKFRYIFFRYDLIEYVKDNRELAQKLKNRQYQPKDIDEIVKEYNSWFASQQQMSKSPKGTF